MHLDLHFLELKLQPCTNLETSHDEGEQNIVAILNLSNNAHNVTGVDFSDRPYFWGKLDKYTSGFALFGAEIALCNNLQKSRREGEQNIIAILNLSSSAHNDIGVDVSDRAYFWKKVDHQTLI